MATPPLIFTCVPGMVQNERGESPRGRYKRSRRLGEGQEPAPDLIRGTGTGYEVWYIRDEPARDGEVLHPRRGCAL